VFLPELEMELQTLCQVMVTATGYMRAQGERLEEHLLDVPKHISDAVEYGVRRGATIALTAAHVWSSYELHFLISFLEGKEATDHERLIEDFDKAMDTITFSLYLGPSSHE
jgi:hypothetical protein